jgi:RecJ-like exonuclease
MAQVEKCSICDGKGYTRCPICNGTGRIKKVATPLISKNVFRVGEETVECQSCQGTGKLLCKICNGAGKILIEKPSSTR